MYAAKTLILPMISILLNMGTTSCKHKRLCFPDTGSVQIRFDWSALTPEDDKPGSMRVVFFDTDGRGIVNDLSHEGGTIHIPDGRYHVVAYNNDSETLLFKEEELRERCRAYTRYTDLMFNPLSERKIAGISADKLYHLFPDRGYRAESESETIIDTDYREITLYPIRYTHTVATLCTHIEAPSEIIDMRLVLLDVPIEYALGMGMPASVRGNMLVQTILLSPASLGRSRSVTEMFGQASTDGYLGASAKVMAHYRNGGTTVIVAPITTDMVTIRDPYHAEIIINHQIRKPEPIAGGSGFNATIEEWVDAEIKPLPL